MIKKIILSMFLVFVSINLYADDYLFYSVSGDDVADLVRLNLNTNESIRVNQGIGDLSVDMKNKELYVTVGQKVIVYSFELEKLREFSTSIQASQLSNVIADKFAGIDDTLVRNFEVDKNDDLQPGNTGSFGTFFPDEGVLNIKNFKEEDRSFYFYHSVGLAESGATMIRTVQNFYDFKIGTSDQVRSLPFEVGALNCVANDNFRDIFYFPAHRDFSGQSPAPLLKKTINGFESDLSVDLPEGDIFCLVSDHSKGLLYISTYNVFDGTDDAADYIVEFNPETQSTRIILRETKVGAVKPLLVYKSECESMSRADDIHSLLLKKAKKSTKFAKKSGCNGSKAFKAAKSLRLKIRNAINEDEPVFDQEVIDTRRGLERQLVKKSRAALKCARKTKKGKKHIKKINAHGKELDSLYTDIAAPLYCANFM